MNIDLVLSGGGVKAYAYLGVLDAIEERKLTIERTAGTSAGAIVAAFIAAGYRKESIIKMVDTLDEKTFLDEPMISKFVPFSKWFVLYYKMGLYKGAQLEKWIYEQLAKKDIFTFKDLQPGYLKIIVSDISLGKLVVIPDDLERIYKIDPSTFSVAKAIRMSAGFPFFFMPIKLLQNSNQKSLIVDGGLLSNFPIWVFENKEKSSNRPILGVKLSEDINDIGANRIKNALDMLHALFNTMKVAHDTRYISKSDQHNIIFIPVDHIKATNFSISNKTKEQLIETGKQRATTFLKRWP